ncbi:ADP-dependent DNA helicase RecQ, putative (WRN) [Plasmodium malariae]|uniref:DNA 3'-5' helicase n=1 Tax=Plasmodium malariae TaxID=5858 RepID=A0A1A8WE81_PLAMA|nr:ADP-dependent DNA helicase RecQ, putative (WRN) [Plasmodium malariae]
MLKYVEVKKSASSMEAEQSEEDSCLNFSLNEMREKMEKTQKKHFGYKNLKDFQVEAVHAIFHKKDSFIVMATGMGKSLCYQIPSLMSECKNKFTVVISPLISLMKDQVDNLNRKKISSIFLGSGQKMSNEKILCEIKHGVYKIVYCSPEHALNNKNLFLSLRKRILLIAIDEVHCMSEWGHDFRPSYRKLNELRTILKEIPIMCLTATCTKEVQTDILKNLNFNLSNCLIKRSSVNKKNLFYSVKEKTNLYEDLKDILDIPLKKCLDRTKRFIDNSKICPYNSTLIYVNSKKECESIHDFLKDKGLLVKMYHGDLSNEQKKDAHEKFLKDEIQIIVATVAFGMGIDKPDIRRIIHYGFSRSLEAYVQQVGRAGRDNSNAEALLFFHINDESKTKNLILRENTANNLIETNFQRVEHIISMFTEASDYAYSTACRRRKIYEYFDEKPLETFDIQIFDSEENEGVCYYIKKYDIYLCAKCDNCIYYLKNIRQKEEKKKKKKLNYIDELHSDNLSVTLSSAPNNSHENSVMIRKNNQRDTLHEVSSSTNMKGNKKEGCPSPQTASNILEDVVDLTKELKVLLNCISSLRGKTGISTICKILVKSKESSIIKKNYHNIKEYGEGAHKSTTWWSSFMKVARNDKYIKETLNYGKDMSYLSIGLTNKGERFMKNEDKYFINLPFFLADSYKNVNKKNDINNKNPKGRKGKRRGKFNYIHNEESDTTFRRNDFVGIHDFARDDLTSKFEGFLWRDDKQNDSRGGERVESQHDERSNSRHDGDYICGHVRGDDRVNEKTKERFVVQANLVVPKHEMAENKYDYFNADKSTFHKENYEYKEKKLTNENINESIMKILLRTRMLEARKQNIPPFQLMSDQPLKDICNKRLTAVHLIRKHIDNVSPICPNSFLEKVASGIRGFCLLHDLETNININEDINENINEDINEDISVNINGNKIMNTASQNITSTSFEKQSNIKKFSNLISSFHYDNNANIISGKVSNTHRDSRDRRDERNEKSLHSLTQQQENNSTFYNNMNTWSGCHEKEGSNVIYYNSRKETNDSTKSNYFLDKSRVNQTIIQHPTTSTNIYSVQGYVRYKKDEEENVERNVDRQENFSHRNNQSSSSTILDKYNNQDHSNNMTPCYSYNSREVHQMHREFNKTTSNSDINKKNENEIITVLNKFSLKRDVDSGYNQFNEGVRNNLIAFFDDDFKFINEVEALGLNRKSAQYAVDAGGSTTGVVAAGVVDVVGAKTQAPQRSVAFAQEGPIDLSAFIYQEETGEANNPRPKQDINKNKSISSPQYGNTTHLKTSSGFPFTTSTTAATASTASTAATAATAATAVTAVTAVTADTHTTTMMRHKNNFNMNLNSRDDNFTNSFRTNRIMEEKSIDIINEKKKKFDLIDSFTYDYKKNYEPNRHVHSTNVENASSFRDLKKRKF